MRNSKEKSQPVGATLLPKLSEASINKAEAKTLVENVKRSSSNIFGDVVLMKSKQANVILGFDNAQECLKQFKTDLSESYISLLLGSAEIYLKLDPKLYYFDKVSGAIFRPLHTCTDAHAKAVWKRMLAAFDDKKCKRIKVVDITNAMASLSTLEEASNVVDDKTLRGIQQCATKLSKDKLFANCKTKSEWQKVAGLICQQLHYACPPNQLFITNQPVVNGGL